MQILSVADNFPVTIIKEFYSEEDLKNIFDEITAVEYFTLPPEKTGSAFREGKPIKQNSGVFLDYLFSYQRDKSKILKINRKIFDPNIVNALIQNNIVWTLLEKINFDITLLSYYTNTDQYLPHEDFSPVTVLSYFLLDKDFTGGELFFPKQNILIPIENNMTIVMLGSLEHQVKAINTKNSNFCRVCMSQFLFINPTE